MLGADRAGPIRETLRIPGIDLHVPALCDVEVTSGLRRATLQKRLSATRARDALDDYRDLPLLRHGHVALLGRIFELRANFSAYDATYVALAESLGAELLTADERLVRSVRSHGSVGILP